MLDAYSGDDTSHPRHHLAFDTIGQIRSRSPRGAATIETCGLDRRSLVQSRAQVAGDAHRCCRRILNHYGLGLDATEPLGDLRALGGDDRPFAGTARSVAEQMLGQPEFPLTWDDICSL